MSVGVERAATEHAGRTAGSDHVLGVLAERERLATLEQDADVAAVFDGWGPKVHERLRSGSPATEIVRAAKTLGADLVVVASGSRGLSETVLLGSTAQRVQHSAPCPVLVVRPTRKK